MPKPLTDLQRRAGRLQTIGRPQANQLQAARGQPFVHAGGERYLTVAEAIVHLGIEETLELARDRRSLLYWPDCHIAASTAAGHAWTLGLLSMTLEERAEVQSRPSSRECFQLPVYEHSTPTYRLLQAVAQDFHVLNTRKKAGEDKRLLWTLDPEVLGRLLCLLREVMVLYVVVEVLDDSEAAAALRLRRNIAEHVRSPREAGTRQDDILKGIIDGPDKPDPAPAADPPGH